jgi:gas vesicle protein
MSQRIYYSDEARQQVQRETAMILAIVLALGISIGTAIAMLFAPKRGEEVREDIVEVTDGAFKRLEKQFHNLREQVEDRLAHK